jgi:hypothetical protein
MRSYAESLRPDRTNTARNWATNAVHTHSVFLGFMATEFNSYELEICKLFDICPSSALSDHTEADHTAADHPEADSEEHFIQSTFLFLLAFHVRIAVLKLAP